MPTLKTYSYKRAGAILREDQPYSIRTIERMVDAGDLERIGDRMRRAISERSIIAYQEGQRGGWHENAKKNRQAGASQTPATPPKRKTAHGRGISQRLHEDTMLNEDSIPSRLPRLGVIRS